MPWMAFHGGFMQGCDALRCDATTPSLDCNTLTLTQKVPSTPHLTDMYVAAPSIKNRFLQQPSTVFNRPNRFSCLLHRGTKHHSQHSPAHLQSCARSAPANSFFHSWLIPCRLSTFRSVRYLLYCTTSVQRSTNG